MLKLEEGDRGGNSCLGGRNRSDPPSPPSSVYIPGYRFDFLVRSNSARHNETISK